MTDSPSTIAELLDRAVATWPDAEFVVIADERVTFAEVDARATAIARALNAYGVGPRDHVGILLDDGVDYAATIFATAKLGAVAVTLNARYRSVDLAYALEHSDCDVLVTGSDGTDFASRLLELFPELDRARSGRLELPSAPRLRQVVSLGVEAPRGFIARAELDERAAKVHVDALRAIQTHVKPDDIAMIIYTSGTSGMPKGCMLRHGALVRNGASLARAFRMSAEDRVWVAGTFFHMMAVEPLFACASAGATFVGMRFHDPQLGRRLLAQERCTIAIPVRDNDWMPVVDAPGFDDADLSALRMTYCVGLPANVRHTQERFHWAPQVGAMGCTEVTGMVALGAPDDPEDSRLTSGGHPFPGVEISVVDEEGRDLPAGEVGHIVYRGYCVFAGYYKDPGLTSEVIAPDGAFKPGDLAFLDEEGRPTFAGTQKAMIRVGGENVSYLEVENLLCSHPAVRMATVVGVRDERYGRVPAAFIELEPGATASEQELLEYGIGRLATFKLPRYVRVVEEWPMSATKIQRGPLKERLERELDEAGVRQAPKVSRRRGATA